MRLWNVSDGSHERTLTGHKKGISDVAWSHDSTYVCSGSDDKTVRIFNVNTVNNLKKKY